MLAGGEQGARARSVWGAGGRAWSRCRGHEDGFGQLQVEVMLCHPGRRVASEGEGLG
jgi:hypothetical protein